MGNCLASLPSFLHGYSAITPDGHKERERISNNGSFGDSEKKSGDHLNKCSLPSGSHQTDGETQPCRRPNPGRPNYRYHNDQHYQHRGGSRRQHCTNGDEQNKDGKDPLCTDYSINHRGADENSYKNGDSQRYSNQIEQMDQFSDSEENSIGIESIITNSQTSKSSMPSTSGGDRQVEAWSSEEISMNASSSGSATIHYCDDSGYNTTQVANSE